MYLYSIKNPLDKTIYLSMKKMDLRFYNKKKMILANV